MEPLNLDQSLRILLVEDDPINSKVMCALLESTGHRITPQEDGVGALTQLYLGTWDLILLDLSLPDLDGYTISRRIRGNAEPSRAQLPIVAITASQDEDILPQVLAAGMNGLLRKPIDMEDFRRVLHNPHPITLENPPAKSSSHQASRPTDGDTHPILDATHWNRMVTMLDRATLLETVVLFQQNGPHYLQQAQSYADSGQWIEVELALHKLAGASANMALGRLGEQARLLEHYCINQAEPEIHDDLKALNRVMQRSLKALEQMANMV
ncbi:response regulator [Magnetococcus sp. PR-3]|uniref:response regulator n=1 Tax=Magnetococcus sp. PR-3 TaxID=3120355 RepID=UPI002FCDF717